MDSNHRRPEVSRVSLPLDHGIVYSKWPHPASHREPTRKPWDSNPQASDLAACFQDRFLIQPDDFQHRIAGAGIEPADTWFKATDFYQQKLPRSETKGRVGLQPTRWCLTNTCSAAELPTQYTTSFKIIEFKCPAGIEPASPGWKPGTFAARPRAQK